MASTPKLSVFVITYNQANYIGEALDSILAQRVNFDYEIIIGDDASKDGTQEIIKDYQCRWPDKVKPVFREQNVGMMSNAIDTWERCRGEYIACLEGDDYWTATDKLQSQVDYLDKNRGAALCHHRVSYISWPGGKVFAEYPPRRYRVERPDPNLLARFNYIQTCSLVFRRMWMPQFDAQFQQLKLGDWPLCVLLSQRGWIGYIDRDMAYYRVHTQNSWNNRPADYKVRAMEQMAWYLLERVEAKAKDSWRDTILALAFKDLAIALKSLSLGKASVKFGHFVNQSLRFRKPFWVFNRLWPYYKANHLNG